jgi:hypothetical protein
MAQDNDKPRSSVRAEEFALLADAVEDYAIFFLTPEGNVRTWNLGANRIMGYEADEIIGRHFSTFYGPEDLATRKPDRELETALREGRIEDEGWRVRKDGTRFWANTVITVSRDQTGTLRGFAKVTRDMTARRAAEENAEIFQLLVSSVRDYAIFMLDPEGHIASWNLGAERIKGYTAPEILGSHFSRFYTEEDLKDGKPARELKIATATGVYEEEGWRVRKDGSLFWASVTITALRDSRGELRGFAKVTRDLTQRRQAEQQRLDLVRVQAARDEAEKANQVKDEFMAVLSHELRTPLNAIVGWAHLLRTPGSLPADQAARGLEAIERNAKIQTQIVSDMLDISRITSGKVRLSPRRIDVREPVAAAVDTVRPAAEAKGIELTATPATDPQFVWGDADRLQQVLWNVLSNAVKFTARGGHVDVNLTRVDSRIAIAIRDDGIGIAPEFLPHVFETFRQADSSSSRTHGGLGLGLAITKRLVELHGGDVMAESQGEGRGTTVTIKLPVLPVSAAQWAEADRPPSAARLDGISVLVVDDHEDSRELIATMLQGLGATVRDASGASAGFDLLRTHRPDVLVSDLEMPGESGYELIHQVRSLSPEAGGLTPAIALTAYARPEDRDRVLAAGFQAHVAKPALPEDLAAAITSLVGWRRP